MTNHSQRILAALDMQLREVAAMVLTPKGMALVEQDGAVLQPTMDGYAFCVTRPALSCILCLQNLEPPTHADIAALMQQAADKIEGAHDH